MALDPQQLKELVTLSFPNSDIQIQDLMGDNDHYAVKIVSSAFEGKSRIQQHQMVYAALQGRMGKELHALSINTATPPTQE